MAENYVEATSLAEKHDVSMSTIRRRILEGKLFPGARKAKIGFGEIWLIPCPEADAATLKNISPKLYQKRYKKHLNHVESSQDNYSSSESLEDRIARLERLYMKLIDRVSV